ncbi:succinylglutamate desuccinylase [Bradyrhizobium ottawaense]|uniref:succinylglutamate desuccinylase/aspartoacylase domain-containing protein n=1 Tax=Bradyrhizobium ottawaense TaxID=931866 RepID=UPI000BEA7E57|nr:succinylglutamate desuccinylase/aspartoacylase family protein [Bradyrhizobium ottawaense]PDT64093.1 succinylglutamate desuccinylase [Bradyrhizobium ottawaense]
MKQSRFPSTGALVRSHTFVGSQRGIRFIVLGAVHGNETCGTIAIEKLLHELLGGEIEITAGQLTLVPVTNLLAYQRGTRDGDRNLNRNFGPTETPHDNEDRIANELGPLIAAHDVLLDIHSFGWPSVPFVLLGPEDNSGELEPFGYASEEDAFAECLGVRLAVDGWLAANAAGARSRGSNIWYCRGTTEYMRSRGGYGVTLECGQHSDPDGQKLAYRAIRRSLAHLRLIDAQAPERKERLEILRIYEAVYYSTPKDRFARKWKSFDRLYRGDVVGYRADGTPVVSPEDGFIAFPSPKANPGAEWFYFARPHPSCRNNAKGRVGSARRQAD